MAHRATTWRAEITGVMRQVGDCWGDVVAITGGTATATPDLGREFFKAGWVHPDASDFMLWTNRHIYFPIWDHEGSVECVVAPRNPPAGSG